MYRPIRLFTYSVLLNSNFKFHNKETMFIDEFEYNECTRLHIESLDTKYLNFNLNQIWCEKCSTADKRYDLFIDCIKISANDYEQIRQFEEHYEKKYFIPCAILRYIVKFGKVLTSNDIRAFLLTFVSEKLTHEHETYINNFKVSTGSHLCANVYFLNI